MTAAEPFIAKLETRSECSCGKKRSRWIVSPEQGKERHGAIAVYDCGAKLEASRDGIRMINACETRTHLSADLMTIEVLGKVKR